MNTKNSKKRAEHRNRYTLEQKAAAKRYYLMGLNLQEISVLLGGCPVRTLEKWQKASSWRSEKEVTSIKVAAFNLSDGGKTYAEIAEILNISRSTAIRYAKTVRLAKNSK